MLQSKNYRKGDYSISQLSGGGEDYSIKVIWKGPGTASCGLRVYEITEWLY